MAVASQTLILGKTPSVSPLPYSVVGTAFSPFSCRNSTPEINYHFSPKPNFYKPHNLTLSCNNPLKPYTLLACCSIINPSPSPLTEPTRQDPTESPRTVSTLVGTAILVSKLFGNAMSNYYVQGVCKMPSPNQLLTVQQSRLFFAAMKIHRQQLDTPWTIMAFGLAKCIEVYMAVLAIRCALSFFPDVEWKSQPYSGLRDMCDPFLLFFQNLVPPVFDSLDISASVGFMVLTVLIEILTSRPF